MLAGSLVQQPGRTTFDTKYDLTADPAGFLLRSLHLWNPEATFGELQNQSYGYLFPQGLWFVLGDGLGVPDWVSQRLWSALLLILAYEGCRGLASALGLGQAPSVLAGLVYALSPRLLGAVGVLSGEVLPSVFLPWLLWPLVLGLQGRLSPRAAASRSGLAVLAMSGVNAVGTLALLPAAVILLLSRVRHPEGRRLLLWWSGCVALATVWWLGPLLLLGRYSPPFLDYIETSAATTFPTSWANDVRGADHWVAYYTVGGRDWWPGAHTLVSAPVLIVLAGCVAALGMYGVCRRDMPLRTPLVLTMLLGLLCLVAGNLSAGGSLIDGFVRSLLDGGLAPLRNVHKVDPLIRLPIALGAAHAAAGLAAALAAFVVRRGRPHWREPATSGVALVLLTVVLAGAWPVISGGLRMPGWTDEPPAWAQTADYLADQPGSRALVLPGTGFGLQTWGWTIDEPLQGAARAPWASRSQVPLAPGATARVLDAIEQRVATGVGSTGLADMLARTGVTHVVLRRDLDVRYTDSVPVTRAEHALVTSPGLTRVAGFGRSGFGGQSLVDVYRVDRDVDRVSLVSGTATRDLAGAPEDVLTALEADVLDRTSPVRLTATPVASPLVGDGYVKVERQFGRVHDAVGQNMSAAEDYREDRRQHDFPGGEDVPRATTEFLGGLEVGASSSQGYVDVFGPVRPDFGPAAAFDGSGATAWRSAPLERPDGQWLDVRLAEPVGAGAALIRFAPGGDGLIRVVRARVSLDGESAVHVVPEDGMLTVDGEGYRRLRVEVVEVAAAGPASGQVGIAEVQIPGVAPGRTRVLPGEITPDATLLFGVPPQGRACLDLGFGVSCERTELRGPQDNGALDRTFTTAAAGAWTLSGTVGVETGPGAARLLAPLGDAADVTADSVYGGDPAVAGLYAFDGDPKRPWLSEPGADRATLTWRWRGVRPLTRITAVAAGVGLRPATVVVTASGGRRTIDLSTPGMIAPLRARGGVSLTFLRAAGDTRDELPLDLGEVTIDGVEGINHAPDPEAVTGADCGLGPEIVVDGTAHQTRVEGTIRDVLAGTSLRWEACDERVALAAGEHRVLVRPTAQFAPRTLVWLPVGATPPTAADTRDFRVGDWAGTSRSVVVAPGEEAVLRVTENVNDGWHAELDGEPLEEVAVDGWQQGYVVPAGEGGTVELVYSPDRVYRWALLVGLLAALALVALAVVTSFRSVEDQGPDLVTGVGPRDVPVPALALLAGALLVVGGPWVAGAYVVALVAARTGPGWLRSSAPYAGMAALVASAAVAAARDATVVGRPGTLADAAAAIGVGLLVGAALALRGDARADDRHA